MKENKLFISMQSSDHKISTFNFITENELREKGIRALYEILDAHNIDPSNATKAVICLR